jgi:transcription elongation factor Elf1
MDTESPQVVCVACGELVPLSSCAVDAEGNPTCADCQLAGRGIESEVWVGPICDWSAPYGGRT